MRPILIVFFIFFIVKSPDLIAQNFNPKCRYTAVGFSIKGSYFDGDVSSTWQLIRPGFGASIHRKVSPRITLVSELSWIRILGDDYVASSLQVPAQIPNYIRNLHFRNDVTSIAVSIKYDLLPSPEHYRNRPIYNIYGGIGLALFNHNPIARIFKDSTSRSKHWQSLRPLETENVSYSQWGLSIPVSIGIRYKLSLQWDLEVEFSYNYTFTDYLDDVSGRYVNPNDLRNDAAKQMALTSAVPISGYTGRQRDLDYIQNQLGYTIVNGNGYSYVQGYGPGDRRGTKKGNDAYAVLSFRLLYAIPGRVNCPKFRELQ